jgi:aspartyl/asparaginyl-tRNA synthetase
MLYNIGFADIYDDMEIAENYLKFCLNYVLENNLEDLQFLEKGEKGLVERLKNVAHNDFQKLTYTEAIKIVEEVSNFLTTRLMLKIKNSSKLNLTGVLIWDQSMKSI